MNKFKHVDFPYGMMIHSSCEPKEFKMEGSTLVISYSDQERATEIVDVAFCVFHLGKYSRKIMKIEIPKFFLSNSVKHISIALREAIQELYDELDDLRGCVALNFKEVFTALTFSNIKVLMDS
mgnify:CR=1 FL=1